ncbi:MAG: hypothetical protein WC614_07030 [bacterium]
MATTTIFISHSKRDQELIGVIGYNFRQIDVTPILEEYSPESSPPYEKIDRDIASSSAVFVFLTQNAKITDYTQNWINYEITKAHDLQKPTFVIEDVNNLVHFPIPKLSNYILYDPTKVEDWKLLQKLANKIKESLKSNAPLVGLLIGATAGALVSKKDKLAGALIGSILGGIFGSLVSSSPSSEQLKAPYQLKCANCGIVFNLFTNTFIKTLQCPSCRTGLYLTD